jgi:hypothetical protein
LREKGTYARVRWLKTTEDIHTTLIFIIQILRLALPSKRKAASLVASSPDKSVHSLLTRFKRRTQILTFRRKVSPIIQNLAKVESDELIPEGPDFTIQRQTFKVDVHVPQQREARGLVTPTGFERACITRFYDINSADPVATGDGVGFEEQFKGLGDGFALRLEFDGETLFKVDNEIFGGVGCVLWVNSQFPHVLGRSRVGVLEDSCLIGAVGHVFIHGPGLRSSLNDGDFLLGGICQEGLTAGEAIVEFWWLEWFRGCRRSTWETPRSDDFNVRLQCVKGQFEADLIVAFACTAMGDSLAAFLLRNLHLSTGNDWTSERSSKQIDTLIVSNIKRHSKYLVDGIALNGREDQLFNKFFAEVLMLSGGQFGKSYLDVDGDCADLECLFLRSFKIFLLSNIGH